jgi:hypothetical protein
VQHDFLHLSFFKDAFREFVDTLQAALREIDKRKIPKFIDRQILDYSVILVGIGPLWTPWFAGAPDFQGQGSDTIT